MEKFAFYTIFFSTFPFLLFLYTVSWRYKTYYLHVSIDILYIFVQETLDSFIPCSYLQYKKGPDINLPTPNLIFVAIILHRPKLKNLCTPPPPPPHLPPPLVN